MSYNTFTPSRNPTSIDADTEVRTLVNEFGDGYELSIKDGINCVRLSLTLNWDNLTVTQYKNINTFLESQESDPFYYVVPNLNETHLFRCTKWSHSMHDLFIDVTAEFEEVFA